MWSAGSILPYFPTDTFTTVKIGILTAAFQNPINTSHTTTCPSAHLPLHWKNDAQSPLIKILAQRFVGILEDGLCRSVTYYFLAARCSSARWLEASWVPARCWPWLARLSNYSETSPPSSKGKKICIPR